VDQQDSRMKRVNIQGLITVPWTILSTVVYGTVCIMVSLFSRNVARRIAQAWNIHLLAIAGIKLVVTGKEKIDKNKRYVFIVNHQSGLDIPILYAGLSHSVSFIAKKELFIIPIFGWGLYAVGHIWIDRGNARMAHRSIERAVGRLKDDNVSLILFPEGTRSSDGKVAPFKQGSFALALKAGVKVVPVAIRNAVNRLPKHSIVVNPGTVYLDIGEPVEISPEMTKADLAEQFHLKIKHAVENGGWITNENARLNSVRQG
jgi:1-acyl-sn-glycerol-3-phosphate acyltransferase